MQLALHHLVLRASLSRAHTGIGGGSGSIGFEALQGGAVAQGAVASALAGSQTQVSDKEEHPDAAAKKQESRSQVGKPPSCI